MGLIILSCTDVGRRIRDNVFKFPSTYSKLIDRLCWEDLLANWYRLFSEVVIGSVLLWSPFCLVLFSGCSQELSSVMALGLRCSRLVHPAFCNFLAALTRPVSEVTLKTVSGRQNDHGQYLAYPAVPIRHFATKKAKGRGMTSSPLSYI